MPNGSYIAGPTFGDFRRASCNIYVGPSNFNETLYEHKRHDTEVTPARLNKRKHPHHDSRKFLMLIDKNGQETFKACSPTCVDVEWSVVPTMKRIAGFGRKSKGQDSLPKDFIPRDLMSSQGWAKSDLPAAAMKESQDRNLDNDAIGEGS